MLKLIILLATIVCAIQGESEEKQEGWLQDFTFGYPYVVSIQSKNEDDPEFNHLCTGSIIRRHVILTSASCFDNLDEKAQYSVRVGSRHLYEEGEVMDVEKIVKHPDYKPGQNAADIAVVILKDGIKFRKQAQQMPLPPKDFKTQGEGRVAGFGGTQTLIQQSISQKLNFAHVSVIPVEESKKYYSDLAEDQFAVGGIKTPNAPCQGTAGIPLVIINKTRPVIAGLAQKWPESCEGPALFTEVAKHLDFILQFK